MFGLMVLEATISLGVAFSVGLVFGSAYFSYQPLIATA